MIPSFIDNPENRGNPPPVFSFGFIKITFIIAILIQKFAFVIFELIERITCYNFLYL